VLVLLVPADGVVVFLSTSVPFRKPLILQSIPPGSGSGSPSPQRAQLDGLSLQQRGDDVELLPGTRHFISVESSSDETLR